MVLVEQLQTGSLRSCCPFQDRDKVEEEFAGYVSIEQNILRCRSGPQVDADKEDAEV